MSPRRYDRRNGISELQAMVAIGIILLFVLVLAGLNLFEFGRVD